MKLNGSSTATVLRVAGFAGAISFAIGSAQSFAQAGPMFANPGGPVVGSAHLAPVAPPPPPGVPGAAANTAVAAPSGAATAGINPTTELFEAINKGDLASARDAIGRGADLDAKSVLGMTPLEDAVDLNRNDIAFLLLSIAHEGGAAAGSASAAPTINAPPAPAAMPGSGGAASSGSVEDILLANGNTTPSVHSRAVGVPRAGRGAAVDPPDGRVGNAASPSAGFQGFGSRN